MAKSTYGAVKSEEIFEQDPLFTDGDGKTLLLSEIIKTKKITKVVIGYLSKKKSIPSDNWFFKKLGFKKEFQEEKELIIYDTRGILFEHQKGIESVSVRFWSKEEFDQLSEKNYDETTLWKRYIYTVMYPYQISFHIGNLKKVEWVEKLKQDF